MKVAVTGASGFIGRHVVQDLASRAGLELTAMCRGDVGSWLPSGVRHVRLDIERPSRTDFATLGHPDVLIHLAWAGLPHYKSLHHFESELPRQYAFLKSLLDAGLSSLLVAGTCYEYGMRCGRMVESMEPRPANAYSYAKDALRSQLQLRHDSAPFALTWARLFYTHGEGQAPSSLYAQLVGAIARGDRGFPMSGGEQLRDYLPVRAVASALADLALHAPDAGIVNVCSGEPVSVRTLVERWARERESDIVLELGRYGYPDHEPMAFWGSRDRLDAVLADARATSVTPTSRAAIA